MIRMLRTQSTITRAMYHRVNDVASRDKRKRKSKRGNINKCDEIRLRKSEEMTCWMRCIRPMNESLISEDFREHSVPSTSVGAPN